MRAKTIRGMSRSRSRRPHPAIDLRAGDAGRDQTAEEHGQGILDDPIEDQRSRKGVERSTERPARGDREVEGRRVPGRRPRDRQLAMTDQGPDEEGQPVQGHPGQVGKSRGQDHHQGNHDEGKDGRRQPGRSPRPPGERHDVGQQVKAQRDCPEQRHRRQVRRHVGRDGQEPCRGDERQEDPPCDVARGKLVTVAVILAGWAGSRVDPERRVLVVASPTRPGDRRAAQDQRGKRRKPEGPRLALVRQGQRGFDDPGIGQEAQQAPRIARRVEEIGVVRAGVPAEGIPALKQGSRGGDREEG